MFQTFITTVNYSKITFKNFPRERQKYEKQITEVSQELEAMRLSVFELLEENEKLPESERIDRHEFELVKYFFVGPPKA